VVAVLKAPLVPLMVKVLVPAGVLPLVEIVRVDVQDGPVADLGLKLAVARDGSPVTLKPTVPAKPLSGVTVTRMLTFEPCCTVADGGAEIVKPLTFWFTGFDVLGLSLLSPPYWAVIG
jgi:hypothetical protein